MSAQAEDVPETLLVAGSEFAGTVAFQGSACIAGNLTGRVHGRGQLRIEQGAHVRARVDVDELVLAGRLEGQVEARVRAQILAGGSLRGVLRTERLQLAEGGRLDGRCETLSDASGPAGAETGAERPPG